MSFCFYFVVFFYEVFRVVKVEGDLCVFLIFKIVVLMRRFGGKWYFFLGVSERCVGGMRVIGWVYSRVI